MSLLNDALKRAETDKVENSSGPGELPEITPVMDDDPHNPRFRWVTLLGVVMLVGAGVGWYFTRQGGGGVPTKAAAKPALPKAVQGLPTPPPGVAGGKAKVRIQPAPKTAASAETQLALTQTLDGLKYHQAAKAPRVQVPPEDKKEKPEQTAGPAAKAAPNAQETSVPAAKAAEGPQEAPTPATQPAIASQPAPPQQPAAAPPRVASSTPKPTQGSAPKPPNPPAAKPGPNPAKFQLTGIMEGPQGATAIINGFFVTVGQTVDNAKVVEIGSHVVVLEADGVRTRLRFD